MEDTSRKSLRFAAVSLTGSLLLSMTVLANPPEDSPIADWYAQTYGVSIAEAKRRTMRELEIGKLGQRIQAERPDTFAGLYIEHRPTYRVVVRFTGDAKAQLAAYSDDPLFVAETAPRSLQILLSTQQLLTQRLHEAGIEFLSETDLKTSHVDIFVRDVEQATACLADLPVMKEGFVRMHKTSGFIEPT
ncbi:hypothetical protein [Lysobacter sp. Root604]|uniref:hypothetical protein n=1 Tax=Lysobacter sp. Root604 TaxID=1736568 RepID=UPI000701B5C2|nr:hypothetical protein [Lysobacter sp. Root604]KRA20371.1 hypothetical protein ASD69_03235 [Lysobacter sp. Root604]